MSLYCRTNCHLIIILQSLLEIVDSNLTRAQRDNDLIYHQDVPPTSSLPVIQPASMVASVVPPGLTEPKKILGNDNLIFGELTSWGAQTAIGTPRYLLSHPSLFY
jgi:programmed cell death 6-interacting protein